MAIQEKDVVLRGLDKNGNAIIGKPITRLANVEADAEIKENPADNDYIPIIDTNDSEQMKKTPISAVVKDINNQTPTYNEANPLANLSSGEKLSIAFGKISKAVTDLITHLKDSVKHITESERTAWNGKAAGNHTHSEASQSAAGLMSTDDKKKLDGVATGANAYTHPSTSGNKHIPSGGASGQILRWSADGTAVWGADNNTTYSAMTGASASAAGTAGLVPAPAKGNQAKYLRGDGTWQTPPDTNTTYSEASQSAAGLMSANDKKKLDGVAASANNYSLPAATSAVRGGVKIGYTANGKNYPVQLSNEQMYVNVPWTDNNTTYSAMTGASSSAAGTIGLVPAPAKGDQTKYLRADGTWQTPPDTNTVYTHPTTSGNKHIPSGGATGQILRWGSDGTAVWGADNNTTYSAMTGASASAAGTTGLVPAPDKGAQAKYLRGDGTWQTPPDTNTTYSNMTAATASAAGKAGLVPAPAAGKQTSFLRGDGTWVVPTNTTYSDATSSAKGLMPAADKAKLDSLTELVNVIDNDVTITEIIYNDSIIRLKIVVNNSFTVQAPPKVTIKGDSRLLMKEALGKTTGFISLECQCEYRKTGEGSIFSLQGTGTTSQSISPGTYFI